MHTEIKLGFVFCCDLQTAASCSVHGSAGNFSRAVCSRELPLGSDLPSTLVEGQAEWQRQGRHQICVLGGICARGVLVCVQLGCPGGGRRLHSAAH